MIKIPKLKAKIAEDKNEEFWTKQIWNAEQTLKVLENQEKELPMVRELNKAVIDFCKKKMKGGKRK